MLLDTHFSPFLYPASKMVHMSSRFLDVFKSLSKHVCSDNYINCDMQIITNVESLVTICNIYVYWFIYVGLQYMVLE